MKRLLLSSLALVLGFTAPALYGQAAGVLVTDTAKPAVIAADSAKKDQDNGFSDLINSIRDLGEIPQKQTQTSLKTTESSQWGGRTSPFATVPQPTVTTASGAVSDNITQLALSRSEADSLQQEMLSTSLTSADGTRDLSQAVYQSGQFIQHAQTWNENTQGFAQAALLGAAIDNEVLNQKTSNIAYSILLQNQEQDDNAAYVRSRLMSRLSDNP